MILVEETCWSHWVKFKWWFDSSPYLWASFATFDSIQTFELVRRVNTDVVIAHQLHYFWQHSGDCWDLWLSVTSNLIFGILSQAWRPDDNDNVNKGPQGSGGLGGVFEIIAKADDCWRGGAGLYKFFEPVINVHMKMRQLSHNVHSEYKKLQRFFYQKWRPLPPRILSGILSMLVDTLPRTFRCSEDRIEIRIYKWRMMM